MNTNELTNKQIREYASNAVKGVVSGVVNAANELLSPFAVCNQLKKEKSTDFNAFLNLFGLTRKKFGFNAETFDARYVEVDESTHILVWGTVDAETITNVQKEYESAKQTFETSDKGAEAKKTFRKAHTAYNKAVANVLQVNDTFYKVVATDVKEYAKLLKLMIRERKTELLNNSDETRLKAEKAKKRAAEKAQKEAIKAEKERVSKFNDLIFAVSVAHVDWSQDEIKQEATKLLNTYLAQQKIA